MTPIANALPLDADPKTVAFVSNYCRMHLATYGFQKLLLIGSRARGNARHDSDHDFIIVVADSAPPEIISGASLGLQISIEFNSARALEGFGGIDILILRETSFETQLSTPGSLINLAAQNRFLC